jgi:hypothetical protein
MCCFSCAHRKTHVCVCVWCVCFESSIYISLNSYAVASLIYSNHVWNSPKYNHPQNNMMSGEDETRKTLSEVFDGVFCIYARALICGLCVWKVVYISVSRFSRPSFLIHSTPFGCSKILWEITHVSQNPIRRLLMCPLRAPASNTPKALAVPKSYRRRTHVPQKYWEKPCDVFVPSVGVTPHNPQNLVPLS